MAITSEDIDDTETSTGMPMRQVDTGLSGVVLDRLKICPLYHAIRKYKVLPDKSILLSKFKTETKT